MPRDGHRHRLVIYKYMLDRWWRAAFAVGIALLILAGGLGGLPLLLPQYSFMWVEDLKLWYVAGAGAISILFSILFLSIRKSAYVRPCSDHLKLVTPFFRLNISYNRFRRTYAAELQQLFPPKKMSNWRKELLRPLASSTAVVIELAGFPVSPVALRLFLSPFFFPDKAPRLAILVPDWLALSTELDSLRGVWNKPRHQTTNASDINLFPGSSAQ